MRFRPQSLVPKSLKSDFTAWDFLIHRSPQISNRDPSQCAKLPDPQQVSPACGHFLSSRPAFERTVRNCRSRPVGRPRDCRSEQRSESHFAPSLNRPGFTGGRNSRTIARYGTDIKEESLEAVFGCYPVGHVYMPVGAVIPPFLMGCRAGLGRLYIRLRELPGAGHRDSHYERGAGRCR